MILREGQEWEQDEELIGRELFDGCKFSPLSFCTEGLIASFVEKTCADEGFCHCEGVTAGRGAPVFKVTLLLAHSLGCRC